MTAPLFEPDHDQPGVIEPSATVPDIALPECAVACFFGEVVRDVVPSRPGVRQIATLRSEAGPSPVWQLDVAGTPVAVVHPGVGAPLAAAYLDELIAMGVRRVVACGGAGALRPDLVLGHAVVVDSAVRDEGTSHHYLPASRVVDADPGVVASLVRSLDRLGLAHVVGRTWTTDAIYRETRTRVQRRVDEGCCLVEMEAAALLAVARYRGVVLGQLLLAGDSLAGDEWDSRDWMRAHEPRERLFDAALVAVTELAP